MTAHYRSDPELGCGLAIAGAVLFWAGVAIGLVVGWFLWVVL